jgi:hypothetical protein
VVSGYSNRRTALTACGFGSGLDGNDSSIRWVKVMPVAVGGFSDGLGGNDGWGNNHTDKS